MPRVIPCLEQHLSPAAVARRLSVSRRTVDRLVSSRRIAPVVRLGRLVRVPESSVLSFLESRHV